MWWYRHNRLVLGLKKEGNSDICYNMNEAWWHYANWNKAVKKDKDCMISLIWDISRSQIHRDRKENGGGQGLGGEKNGELLFCGGEFQFCQMKKSFGDGWW